MDGMHLNAAQETAEEMAEAIQDLPPDQLAWLVLRSPLGRQVDWSPEAILIAEMLRRIWANSKGHMMTSRGWITPNGSLKEYE